MTPRKSTISEANLHAYVDGRLPEEGRIEVESFLADNPEEQAKIKAYQEQNRMLRVCFDPVLEEPVPSGWQIALPKRRSLLKPFAAAVACLALGTLLGWYLRGRTVGGSPRDGDFARQAALAHAVYTPEVRHPVEVTAEQEEHLVNWLSKRLGGPIKVPHLGDLGYELVGGRLLPGDRGPVAHFMYQEASGKRLTLYIVRTDPSAETETAFRYSQQGKVAVFYWLDRRLSYALSGEMPKEQLLKLANTIYQRLNP
jgi:anti-sigma factor RsiW